MLIKPSICALILACGGMAHAKEGDAPALKPPATKVKLQFFSVQAVDEPLFLHTAEGDLIPINFAKRRLNPAIEVSAAREWEFGMADPISGEFMLKTSVKPLESDHQILVFTTDKDGGLNVIAADGNPDHFKANTILFANASNTQMGGTLGGQKFIIVPGASEIVALNARAQQLKLRLFWKDRDQFKLLAAGAQPGRMPQNGRALYAFFNNPEIHTLDFVSIHIPAPQQAPPAQAKGQLKPAN